MKHLLAILGVTALGPAIASAVASLIKTVPGIGTLAGGLLQGIVQALITRWIGAVFIHYFRNEMQTSEAGMATVAEEMPEAYKDVADVVNVVHGAGVAVKVAQLRPIGVIKG